MRLRERISFEREEEEGLVYTGKRKKDDRKRRGGKGSVTAEMKLKKEEA